MEVNSSDEHNNILSYFVIAQLFMQQSQLGLDKISGKVVAYTFGTRGDDTLRILLDKLKDYQISFYFTDGWGSYCRLLDSAKHIVSKKYTQLIERFNLTWRTRCKRLARKTICFSKSEIIHDKVIGTMIEKIAF